ncbi:MAG TPA: YafY family protein [Xanthomonadaceae bacterium]|nr:YafY family protein [Xanthomonadaceae bacterium]
MERYERIVTLHRILKVARYPVSQQRLLDELSCSRATLYRDIAFLRDALGAPIESDTELHGFRYARDEGERFELPGLWLNSDELKALMALQQLLPRGDAELISGALEPLKPRIDALLKEQAGGREWPINRVRVIQSGSRRFDQAVFRTVAGAVLERRRLAFRYRARSTDEVNDREVSPQRLTHYRDNWYLDAWDHRRKGLRSFSLDRIQRPQVSEGACEDMGEEDLNAHLAASYGIFSGAAKAWATIRFSPHAARWAAEEHWHSQQQGQWLADGRYELKVPYSHSRELLMDVLSYGPDAEIIEPVPLREQARSLLENTLAGYARSD